MLAGETLESRAGSAFMAGGAMILASLVAPVALGTVVEWGWAVGVGLVGLGVLATTAGLLGLYHHAAEGSPLFAKVGATGATVAGLAGAGLVGLVGVAGVTVAVGRPTSVEPVRLFVGLGLTVAVGLSTGFLSFGIPTWRAGTPSRTVGKLLTGGGAVLLAATGGELLRTLFEMGPPPGVVFPVLLLVAVDGLVVGRYL